MNKQECLQAFWSSFDWKAYDETSVPDEKDIPDEAKYHRITYDYAESDFNNSISLNASLWSKMVSWSEVTAKSNEIGNFIGRGGVILKYDGGAIWIKKSVPWAQRMGDNNDAWRRIVLGVTLEFID